MLSIFNEILICCSPSAPSKVPSFKVSSIAVSEVTLFWEPVPCSKQNGVILYYQIRTDTQKGKQQLFVQEITDLLQCILQHSVPVTRPGCWLTIYF